MQPNNLNQPRPPYQNQPQQYSYSQPQSQYPQSNNPNWSQPNAYQPQPYYGQPAAPAKKGLPTWVMVVGGLVVVGLLVGLLAATGVLKGSFSFTTGGGPMRVADVTLAKGYNNETAVNPTTTFSPTDNPLHSVVKLENTTAGARITGVWTVIDAGGEQNFEIGRKELTLEAGSTYTAHFTAELNQDWPEGKYKFELLVNDKLEKTVNFTVQ